VPYIHVTEEELVERLSGRLTCRAEGHIFHEKYNPPKAPGKCDIDGSELYQRDDDHPETVKNRIKVFYQQTSPLIDYYRQQGKLIEIDGMKAVEQVSEEVLQRMRQVKAG
jgi:adenylate kinase